MIIRFIFMVAMLSSLALFGADPPKKPETFYSQIQRGIFRLESTDHQRAGSGFFVFYQENDAWYVVTAAHVPQGLGTCMANILMRLTDGTSTAVRMVLPSDKWIFHPDAGDSTHARVDVAVLKIRQHGGPVRFMYCPQHCNANEYNQLDVDPEPPSPVYVFGFPALRWVRLSRPLGRQGIVAFLDDKEETIRAPDNKMFDKRAFLVDIPTITGGYSGSPVIQMPPFGQLTLVGVMSASNLGEGYAVAEPASRIREVLDRPETQKAEPFDPWCMPTEAGARRIGNQLPVCKE